MITKTCFNPECPADNPQPLDNFHKQSTGKHGRNARCRVCVTQAQLDREKNNPQTIRRRRNSHYLREYGITLDQYDSMLQKQNGVCGICHKPEPRSEHLSVDHCHITGEVRGLLCSRCNMVLGMFLDSPALLKSAITYLENA
jgi:hypothetical protein